MSTERIIEIDFIGANTKEEIHNRLAKAFGFPDYYGKNWDAFDECINDLDKAPQKIIIKGFGTLEDKLPREAILLIDCLHDYQQTEDGQGVKVKIE